MEIEDIKENIENKNSDEINEKAKNDFLDMISKTLPSIGLFSPIDIVFLEHFQLVSKHMISEFKNELNNIFRVVVDQQEDRQFPFVSWLEKVDNNNFTINEDPDLENGENFSYVLWVTTQSKNWKTRTIESPGDFHLYFLEEIRSPEDVDRFSIKTLYEEFDKRKGEEYFLNIGSRKNTHKNGTIFSLYVSDKQIVVFKIEKFTTTEEGVISRFVSDKHKLFIKHIEEVAVFSKNETQFVNKTVEFVEEKNEINNHYIEKSDDDFCESCGS